jgi:hypothetical protein
VAICRAKIDELLTYKDLVLSRWKEHFEYHLNEEEARDQTPDQVDHRDDEDEINLFNREISGK